MMCVAVLVTKHLSWFSHTTFDVYYWRLGHRSMVYKVMLVKPSAHSKIISKKPHRRAFGVENYMKNASMTLCVCVFVCVHETEREREREEGKIERQK